MTFKTKIITTYFIAQLVIINWYLLSIPIELPKTSETIALEIKTEIKVIGTMYNAVVGQCDSDPLITAGMYKINPKKASEQ